VLNPVMDKVYQGQGGATMYDLSARDIVITHNGKRLAFSAAEHFELIADFLEQRGNVQLRRAQRLPSLRPFEQASQRINKIGEAFCFLGACCRLFRGASGGSLPHECDFTNGAQRSERRPQLVEASAVSAVKFGERCFEPR